LNGIAQARVISNDTIAMGLSLRSVVSDALRMRKS
jgi:hypothetical protein